MNDAGNRVLAPPVYRPQPTNASASNPIIQPRNATWPPVYRPEAKQIGALHGTGRQGTPTAAAPPVYRPEFPNCGLPQNPASMPITTPAQPAVAQLKVSQSPRVKAASVAPPIYRPHTAAVRPAHHRVVRPSGSNTILPSIGPGGQSKQAPHRPAGFEPRTGSLQSFAGPKMPEQTSAPPVYRPTVGQVQPKQAVRPMSAPPVYRPASVQAKAPPVYCPQPGIHQEYSARSQRSALKPSAVHHPLSGSPSLGHPVQAKQSRFVSAIKPLAGAPAVGGRGNPSRPGTIQASKVKGFFKFAYAKLPGSSQRQVSRYRLKGGAKTKFAQSLLTHGQNREFYSHRHTEEQIAPHREALRQFLSDKELDFLPRNVDVTTVARINFRGGMYGKGGLTANAIFEDDNLQGRVPEESPNKLEAELGEDRNGNKFVDVNTLYSYPIGSGIGQILLYEAAYLAVSNGYGRFTHGAGEGQAATMWRERYEAYIIPPETVNSETAPIMDDRPAPKPAVSSFHMLIGAWAGLANQWEKVSCCCC